MDVIPTPAQQGLAATGVVLASAARRRFSTRRCSFPPTTEETEEFADGVDLLRSRKAKWLTLLRREGAKSKVKRVTLLTFPNTRFSQIKNDQSIV